MSVTQCFVEFLTKKVLCEEIVAEGVTAFDAFAGLAQPFQTKNTAQIGPCSMVL